MLYTTTSKRFGLKCERFDCYNKFNPKGADLTAEDVRRKARKLGWRCLDGRDFCSDDCEPLKPLTDAEVDRLDPAGSIMAQGLGGNGGSRTLSIRQPPVWPA